MGLFETEPDVYLDPQGAEITWKQYICTKFNKSGEILTDSLKDVILDRLGKDPKQLDVIVRLGLIDDLPVEKRGTPIDTLCNYLAKRLSYGAHERDMVLMRHDIGIQWGDGKMEERSIDLVSYGDIGGFSAMAKTVGLPIGIAARMILTGEIQTKGVCCPTAPEMCLSILQRLKNEGIAATEKSTLK
ncbi:alpha-aminoadipic semialdehyde synthase, mitochondrial-like [Physella acuta]|uniref:alpha-aminoadipic semialdehyde synthase, mitochondrial-like n=1 Tax=Physella acuta TaxID=109671 RepID=UPI0027DCD40B|nr:alpha-aminoadipic semialdehyde synthase, mitochondrial-like [Physella acuta]